MLTVGMQRVVGVIADIQPSPLVYAPYGLTETIDPRILRHPIIEPYLIIKDLYRIFIKITAHKPASIGKLKIAYRAVTYRNINDRRARRYRISHPISLYHSLILSRRRQ